MTSTLMRDSKGLLTTPCHQSGPQQAGLCLPVHSLPTATPTRPAQPGPSLSWPGDAGQTPSICRQLEPRGPRTLGGCPQSLRDTLVPAVSPAPGLAFNCHPHCFRQTDRQTGASRQSSV